MSGSHVPVVRQVAVPPPPREEPPLPSARALRAELGAMEAELGSPAWIVGGYVRDLLLGRPEASDVDLVLESAPAQDAGEWLRRRWKRREPVVAFERFGTAQVSFLVAGGQRFTVELVRARREAYLSHSRKPEVQAATLEEDALRRDFTVNTLLLGSRGQVLDPIGRGLEDLHGGLLRTPLEPAATFSEDPLRMLRAARFAAQLGFRIDPKVAEGMRESAARIGIVSVERVRDELLKLLLAPEAATGLHLLLETGLLQQVAPEVAQMAGVEQGGYHLGDVFLHSALAVERAPVARVVRLAALLHDVGKPVTARPSPSGPTFHRHQQVGAEIARGLLRRLRLPNSEADRVARLVELHMYPIQYRSEWADSAVRRLWHRAGDLVLELLQLARADTLASGYPGTAQLDELESRLEAVARENPGGLRPALGGAQLKAWKGWPDGPWIGRAQRLLLEAAVQGELASSAEELEGAGRAYLQQRLSEWQPRPGERGAPSASPGR